MAFKKHERGLCDLAGEGGVGNGVASVLWKSWNTSGSESLSSLLSGIVLVSGFNPSLSCKTEHPGMEWFHSGVYRLVPSFMPRKAKLC